MEAPLLYQEEMSLAKENRAACTLVCKAHSLWDESSLGTPFSVCSLCIDGQGVSSLQGLVP